jgi:tRNA1Val (adenine37-N6)-methyltransferase
MSKSYFKFKQFALKQDKCAMKVGMDGVLLGGWANPMDSKYILDIGTGTGLLALMLAQKTTGLIDAVELDLDASEQASLNFKGSLWRNRLKGYCDSIQNFAKGKTAVYDYIISNPPYFTTDTRSSDIKRARARHADELSLDELVFLVATLLKPMGRFELILPFAMRTKFIGLIAENGLWVQREARIKHTVLSSFERVMFEVSKLMPVNYNIEYITIEETDESDVFNSAKDYTQAYYLD